MAVRKYLSLQADSVNKPTTRLLHKSSENIKLMSLMAKVLPTHGLPLRSYPLSTPPHHSNPSHSYPLKSFSNTSLHPTFSPLHCTNRTLRVRNSHPQNEGKSEVSTSREIQNERENGADDILDVRIETSSGSEISFLAKLAVALGIAATATIICVGLKSPTQGSKFGLPVVSDGSLASSSTVSSAGFTLKVFGYQIVLPEHAPGWIYFWLLMAAACGLFVSEEALNIWVGISLARLLTLDGTWASFAESFSRNASYIIATVLWVYWGVCISDMIPFYFGKLFRQTGASEDICSKLGVDKKKAVSITKAVQKYGNLIGFVERFSIGARNPTAFLAGSLGISPECFFAGVCCGGLVTLPVQLAIGFLLRENPVLALATVATVVGMWTVLPYAMAASTALFFFLRRRYAS